MHVIKIVCKRMQQGDLYNAHKKHIFTKNNKIEVTHKFYVTKKLKFAHPPSRICVCIRHECTTWSHCIRHCTRPHRKDFVCGYKCLLKSLRWRQKRYSTEVQKYMWSTKHRYSIWSDWHAWQWPASNAACPCLQPFQAPILIEKISLNASTSWSALRHFKKITSWIGRSSGRADAH